MVFSTGGFIELAIGRIHLNPQSLHSIETAISPWVQLALRANLIQLFRQFVQLYPFRLSNQLTY